MKDELGSKNHSNDEEVIDEAYIENYLLGILMRGAEQIREKMNVSYESFRFMSRAHNARGRKHYIYEVLNEIEQIVITLTQTQELFSKVPNDKSKDEIEARIRRNTASVIQREQSLHIRRLTETFIELINFSKINKNEYFDHYLLYQELSQREKRKGDLKMYFSCENINNQSTIEMIKQSISRAEQKINLNNCWYLKGGSPKPNGQASLASFKDAFNKALTLATKAEKFILGFSYGEAYGTPSQSIHLSIGGISTLGSFDLLQSRRINRIIILAFYCLLRCRRLLNMRNRKGEIKDLLTGIETQMTDFYELVKPDITKGDFVIVHNSLCEVISIGKSDFGYRSFKVRYLLDSPIGDDKEDCFPAINVKKLLDGKQIRDSIIKLLTFEGKKPAIDSRIVRRSMRETVTKYWQQYVDAISGRSQ